MAIELSAISLADLKEHIALENDITTSSIEFTLLHLELILRDGTFVRGINEETFDDVASLLREREKTLDEYEVDILRKQLNAKQHLSDEHERRLSEWNKHKLKWDEYQLQSVNRQRKTIENCKNKLVLSKL